MLLEIVTNDTTKMRGDAVNNPKQNRVTSVSGSLN